MTSYLVLIGNDCTGKSTLVNQINSLNSDIYALERSTVPSIAHANAHAYLNFKQIDKLTLMTTCDSAYKMYNFDEYFNGRRIYYVVLDADVSVLRTRARTRDDIGIFESDKALKYFKNRFAAIASYFGFPVVINDGKNSVVDVATEIVQLVTSELYSEVQSVALKNMSYDNIQSRLIDNCIRVSTTRHYGSPASALSQCGIGKLIERELRASSPVLFEIYENICNQGKYHEIFEQLVKRKLADCYDVKYNRLVTDGLSIDIYTSIERPTNSMCTQIYGTRKRKCTMNNVPMFRVVTEGESKQILEVLTTNKYINYYIVVLKPTIYSHSKKACGEINDLEKVRAIGSQLILEMFWRNNVNHTYIAINNTGIAHSKIIQTTPIEIVFKKYCTGTDKHSYYNMLHNSDLVIPETDEYKCGPYVRFDWRNPNQVDNANNQFNTNKYYYVLEKYLGKEFFFNNYLVGLKFWGDKAVSEDILSPIIDTKLFKKTALKAYLTVQYYCNQIGLEVKDGCFMIDKTGKYIWSEVNPDCMRISDKVGSNTYDKDIWRAQGANSKELIVDKWKVFNNMFIAYFNDNMYIDRELGPTTIGTYNFEHTIKEIVTDERLRISPEYLNIYKSFVPFKKRNAVFTIDIYDGQPVLVKQGKVFETHSNGDVDTALHNVSICNNVLIADLNGAIDNTKVNRELVKNVATKYHTFNGGGIRSIEDVQDILGASSRRITISSNTDPEFINKIPKNRLTVELSVDEHNKILTHGRKVHTDIDIFTKLNELVDMNVHSVSVTFHKAEGMISGLPRDQIRHLMTNMPHAIRKVFIAGGVSSMDDLKFLWSFDKVVPQLGSAIWKDVISVGEVIAEMGNYDADGLIPAVIQGIDNIVIGVVYMNKSAVETTADTKMLWRYSRQFNKVMLKGEESGNIQYIKHMSFDCDSDTLLVTVDASNPFCHMFHDGKYNAGCFTSQSHKFNMDVIYKWISNAASKYVKKMTQYPGLSFSKLSEEMNELWTSKQAGKDCLIHEASDVFVHLLMFLKSMGVEIDDIMNELGKRHYNPRLVETRSYKKCVDPASNKFMIGITCEKYANCSDNFVLDKLGMRIIRGSGRDLSITYEISDAEKYKSVFGDKIVCFVGIKPKDMSFAVTYEIIHAVIAYNSVLDNLPTVFDNKIETCPDDIKISLIKRVGDDIDMSKWTALNKCKIACEHMAVVSDYFTKLSISPDVYSLHKFLGSSESLLVNETVNRYDLCDAIVSTGKTLEDNNLEEFCTVLNKDEIKIVYAEKVTLNS